MTHLNPAGDGVMKCSHGCWPYALARHVPHAVIVQVCLLIACQWQLTHKQARQVNSCALTVQLAGVLSERVVRVQLGQVSHDLVCQPQRIGEQKQQGSLQQSSATGTPGHVTPGSTFSLRIAARCTVAGQDKSHKARVPCQAQKQHSHAISDEPFQHIQLAACVVVICQPSSAITTSPITLLVNLTRVNLMRHIALDKALMGHKYTYPGHGQGLSMCFAT